MPYKCSVSVEFNIIFLTLLMRIISGTHKGRIIHPPKNLRARPTTDFAKENLFNVLGNIVDIEGAEVLDLFAGTGSISYEFASRGASSVISVELNRVHYEFIKNTAAHFGFSAVHPVKANSFLYLKSTSKKFDIIFADPPYDLAGIETIPDMVYDLGLLKSGGILIVEHSDNKDFSGHPSFMQKRNYGSVNFSIFQTGNDSRGRV